MTNDVHIVKVGPHQQDVIMLVDGICRCICVGSHGNTSSYLKIFHNGKIRKMTTREIGRLMDVDDIDIDKIVDSKLSLCGINSLFGNSIVVNVMTEIFRELFIDRKDKNLEGLW